MQPSSLSLDRRFRFSEVGGAPVGGEPAVLSRLMRLPPPQPRVALARTSATTARVHFRAWPRRAARRLPCKSARPSLRTLREIRRPEDARSEVVRSDGRTLEDGSPQRRMLGRPPPLHVNVHHPAQSREVLYRRRFNTDPLMPVES